MWREIYWYEEPVVRWLAGIALALAALYVMCYVSPEDIENCMKTTGWDEARCEWELHR